MENLTEVQLLSNFKDSFESHKYDEAINILKSNQTLFDPGIYEFNLALVLMKKEDFVGARINFEKAQLNGFRSNELSIGLARVKEALEVNVLEEPKSISDGLSSLMVQIPFDIYLLVSLFFGMIFLIIFKKLDRWIRVSLLFMSLFPSIFYYMYVANLNTVISNVDNVVYRGPSKMFEQIQVIPKGMKLITSEDQEGWKFIIFPESHKGWFLAEDVETL